MNLTLAKFLIGISEYPWIIINFLNDLNIYFFIFLLLVYLGILSSLMKLYQFWILSVRWYLLPYEVENSYGKIIYQSDKGEFLVISDLNIFDIINIPLLTVNDYWENFVIPFLESQPKDIDIILCWNIWFSNFKAASTWLTYDYIATC